MTTKVPAAMVAADVATQAELDAEAALRAASNVGNIVQVVQSSTGAMATGSTVIPLDDTVPQITEGVEYMTATITPKSTTNILKIEVEAYLSAAIAGFDMIGALFRDAGANALAAVCMTSGASGNKTPMHLVAYVTAGSVAATTFRFRAGTATAGTTTFNGAAGARQFGGVAASLISITEIKA